MIAFLLSKLFPPRLPGSIRDWDVRLEVKFEEQGSAGNVQPKRYRDGIDRHFSEEAILRQFGLEVLPEMIVQRAIARQGRTYFITTIGTKQYFS